MTSQCMFAGSPQPRRPRAAALLNAPVASQWANQCFVWPALIEANLASLLPPQAEACLSFAFARFRGAPSDRSSRRIGKFKPKSSTASPGVFAPPAMQLLVGGEFAATVVWCSSPSYPTTWSRNSVGSPFIVERLNRSSSEPVEDTLRPAHGAWWWREARQPVTIPRDFGHIVTL